MCLFLEHVLRTGEKGFQAHAQYLVYKAFKEADETLEWQIDRNYIKMTNGSYTVP